MGIFVLNRQSFPTQKTCAPFGAEAGGDGVGSGDLVVAAVGVLVCVGLAAGVGGRVCGGLFVLAVLWRLFGGARERSWPPRAAVAVGGDVARGGAGDLIVETEPGRGASS